MLTRRLAGVLSWVLLLHLGIVASSNLCTTPIATPTPSQQHHGDHGDHSDNSGAPASTDHRACDMSMACTVALETEAPDERLAMSVDHAPVIPMTVIAHVSPVRAPEPPPPKA